MRRIVAIAAGCLALSGCHKSVDRQFADMCAYQKEHDEATYAESKEACDRAAYVPAYAKRQMVDAYAELQKARAEGGQ